MGRIDEALRRSGKQGGGSGLASVDDERIFASAWTVPEPNVITAPQEPRAAGLRPSNGASVVRPAVVANRRSLLEQFDPEWKERLITSPSIDPAFVEQFRRLAATLVHAQNVNGTKLVMVTSAVPADGKTLTAFNLGMVLSQSYRRRVLLIDADLRRPAMSHAANVKVTAGLSEALKAHDERKAPVIQLTDTLTLLPAGQPDPDPLAGLTSPRMKQLLKQAAEGFDWVILDAPPVEAVADSGLLAAMVDGVLLVIRAGRTQHGSVQRSIEAIGRDKILGVVLNGTTVRPDNEYSGYYVAQPE